VLAGTRWAGEVARYLGRYGSARVAKGVLVSLILPYLLQVATTRRVPQGLFDGFARPPGPIPGLDEGASWTPSTTSMPCAAPGQRPGRQASWNLAVTACTAVARIGTWTTDFRDDLPKIDVPVLVIHGDADQVRRGQDRQPPAGLIKDMDLVVVEGAPHAIAWTHAGQVNTALLDFLRS
jgi:pimeloyl-ACP methyl ester carboxylesterase